MESMASALVAPSRDLTANFDDIVEMLLIVMLRYQQFACPETADSSTSMPYQVKRSHFVGIS